MQADRKLSSGWGLWLLSIQSVIVSLSIVVTVLEVADAHRQIVSLTTVSIIITFASIWFVWSSGRARGALLEPYGLFLIAALLFHFGQLWLVAFGANNPMSVLEKFSDETLAQAIWQIVLGLAVLHLGALLATRRTHAPLLPEDPDPPSRVAAARSVGWGLLAVSAIPMAIQIRSALSVATTRGYSELFQQDAAIGLDSFVSRLSVFAVPAVMLLAATSAGSLQRSIVPTMAAATYTVSMLAVGGRYHALMPMLMFVWLFDRFVVRISRIWLIVGVLIVFVVAIPVTQSTRNETDSETLGTAVWNSVTRPTAQVIQSISEMGGSLRTVGYTLDLVPMYRSHDPLVYAYAASTIVPNVGTEVHPAIAHGMPNRWLVEMVDPYIAARGGGLGYSFIAESYLAFGWLGVALVPFAVGWGYVRFIDWATKSGRVERFAAVATFGTFVTFWVRNDSTFLFRPLVWYAMIPYVMVILIADYHSQVLRRMVRPGKTTSNRHMIEH